MMTRRLNLFAITLCALSASSYYAVAQDASDALRYSHLATQGTARSIGFGGALGSIGGDFSSLSVNPAGIGIYRGSEFTFTPAIRFNSIDGKYTGAEESDNNSRFTVGNLGLVFTAAESGRRYKKAKWKSVSFGIGLNRVADFNKNYIYSGYNNTSSASEIFAISAQNDYNAAKDANSASLGRVGYLSYLLDEDSAGFFSIVPFKTGLNQRKSVRERGSMSEVVISLGGNYQDQLMLGATIGIPTINYKREMTLEESDATNDATNFFSNFMYNEVLTTKGSGLNLKLGAIYKPSDQFRLGLAIHTPTYFGLTDEVTQSIVSNTENFKTALNDPDKNPQTVVQASDLPVNVFEYNLITPMRTVLSASTLLGKVGFITADYEYTDYATTRFRYNATYRAEENYINNIIRKTYKGSHAVRIGGEARFDIAMARLGFGYYTSPYQSASGGDRIDISAGAGLRFDNWFLDLGFVNTRYERTEQPYNLDAIKIIVPTATLKQSLNTVAITVGFKF